MNFLSQFRVLFQLHFRASLFHIHSVYACLCISLSSAVKAKEKNYVSCGVVHFFYPIQALFRCLMLCVAHFFFKFGEKSQNTLKVFFFFFRLQRSTPIVSEEKKTSQRDSMEKNMLNQFQSRLTTVNIFISAANERAGGISESSDKATSLFFFFCASPETCSTPGRTIRAVCEFN